MIQKLPPKKFVVGDNAYVCSENESVIPHKTQLLPIMRHYFFEVDVVQIQQDFIFAKMQIVNCWILAKNAS